MSSCPLRADSVGSRRAENCGVPQLQFIKGSAAVLGQDCLHTRCVQTVLGFAVLDQVDMPVVAMTGAWSAVLGQSVHARCCDDRCI